MERAGNAIDVCDRRMIKSGEVIERMKTKVCKTGKSLKVTVL